MAQGAGNEKQRTTHEAGSEKQEARSEEKKRDFRGHEARWAPGGKCRGKKQDVLRNKKDERSKTQDEERSGAGSTDAKKREGVATEAAAGFGECVVGTGHPFA